MAYTERFVRADANGAGDGTTDANTGATGSWTWAQMLADATAGSVRYNVKAGTYSRTTAADVFTTAGTAALPRSVRGFNATLGDLEANGRTYGGALVTTNFPFIEYTTGGITFPTFFVVEHLHVTSGQAGVTIFCGTNNTLRRCRGDNTHTTSANVHGILGANGTLIDDCDSTISSTHTNANAMNSNGTAVFQDCLAIAPNTAICIHMSSAGAGSVLRCNLRGGSIGIRTSGTNNIDGCSFRDIAGNYIDNTNSPRITNCVAWGTGGSSRFYNSATSVRANYRNNNFVGNMGAADVNPGDWPNIGQVALTADPFTSGTDLSLNNAAGGGALVRALGKLLYLDGGAWQVQPSAAASAKGFVFGG